MCSSKRLIGERVRLTRSIGWETERRCAHSRILDLADLQEDRNLLNHPSSERRREIVGLASTVPEKIRAIVEDWSSEFLLRGSKHFVNPDISCGCRM